MPARLWTALLNRLRPPYRLSSVYEHLLGTELEIQVVAGTRAAAETAEAAALTELRRLTGVLNRFDPHSEFRRWLARFGDRQAVSPDLHRLLTLAGEWRALSGGAFHPGADALGDLWKEAEARGTPPDPAALRALVQELQAPPWTVHPDGTATPHTRRTAGLNALAKGYVVDRMAETAATQPEVTAVLVNAGGDLRTLGGRGLDVLIANPFTARDDALPLGRVWVRDGALATSGQAHRGYRVGETWHSHVLDPRTGAPVRAVPGVTVLAPDCVTADALATVAGVLDVSQGAALVDARSGCAALIVQADGTRHASRDWPGLL